MSIPNQYPLRLPSRITQRPLNNNTIIPGPRSSLTDPDNIELINNGLSSVSDKIDGISDQKPDIILVSEFKPLYNKQTVFIFSDTPAKKYFDTILETRRLKAENSFLEYNRIASSSPEIKSKFSKIFQQNANLVSFLRDKFSSIVEIHADVEIFKTFLDPRERKILLDNELIRNFPKLGTREVLEENIGGDSIFVEAKELLEEMGFTSNNFQYYSNTKVLAQIIQGYLRLCQNKNVELNEAEADTTGDIKKYETESTSQSSNPQYGVVSFSRLPMGPREIFDFCYSKSNLIIWNSSWDKGSKQILNSKGERLFFGNGLKLKKLNEIINLLSTEFSVCFNRTYYKTSSNYSAVNNVFNNEEVVKFQNNLLTDRSYIDALNIYSVLKTAFPSPSTSSIVFDPVNFGNNVRLLDDTDFDSANFTLGKINSSIEDFEKKYISLFKNFGFVPVSERGDDYSQLFSSKSLFENIYYRFFNEDQTPKWNLDETTSYVFSIISNISSEISENLGDNIDDFESGNSSLTSNHLKYLLFILVCSEIGDSIRLTEEIAATFGVDVGTTIRSSEDNIARGERISKLWNTICDLFANKRGGSSDFYISENSLKTSFARTSDVRFFRDYKGISSTQNENLYQIISRTLKEFNYSIEEFCLDEKGKTNHRGFDRFFILLMIFEIILVIIPWGMENFVTRMTNGFSHFTLGNLELNEVTVVNSKQQIIDELQTHDNMVRKFFSFISGYMNQTKESIQNIQRKINTPNIQDFITDINSLNKKISSKQQASISLNSLLDLEPLFVNSEMRTESNLPSYKFVNSSIMGEKTKSAFFSLMKNDKFLNEGRIISVGIPNGFFDQILYSPKELNSRWSYSQKDIVKLKIYKIELTRPDIVFLPVIKEFELSRLIARDDSYLLFDGSGSYDVSVGQFPTRDFDNTGDKNSVQYFHPDPEKRSIRIVTRGDFEIFQALTGNSYDEILNADKIKIYNNHIESYLLEIYTRIMSGISLAEGNISDFSGITPQNLQQNLKKILSDPGIVLEPFESFDRVDPNNPSTLSSTEQIALNVLSPKPYDRVLNVLVRSDDFIIDVIKTTERPGLNNFLDTDTDIEKIINVGYRLKPREYSFESYFVTIETGSGGVI